MPLYLDSSTIKLKRWSKTISDGFSKLGYNVIVNYKSYKKGETPIFLSIKDCDTTVSFDFYLSELTLQKYYNLKFHRFIKCFLKKENPHLAASFSKLVKADQRNRKKIKKISNSIKVDHEILEYENYLFLGNGGFSLRFNLNDRTTIMNYYDSEYSKLTSDSFTRTYFNIFRLDDFFSIDDFIENTDECLKFFNITNY